MQLSTIVTVLFAGGASAALVIGNRQPKSDRNCVRDISNPVYDGECVDMTNVGAVKLYKEVNCNAFRDTKCDGSGIEVKGSKGCHSKQSWNNAGSVRCWVLRKDENGGL